MGSGVPLDRGLTSFSKGPFPPGNDLVSKLV